jgi:hypothetical protein
MSALLRHLRAHAIAYLALLVALSAGTAYAASKIKTKDIANSAVTSKKIKDGQVKPKDLTKGVYYDSGPPVGVDSSLTSSDKTVFTACPKKDQVPVTGGAFVTGADISENPVAGKVALSESRAAFPPAYPDVGWVASAIEVNGGTAESWVLHVNLVCAKVSG